MNDVREQLRRMLAPVLKDPHTLEAAVSVVAEHGSCIDRQLITGDVRSAEKTATIEGAAVDLDRQARCGFPEVVFGEGKPAELVIRILHEQEAAGQPSLVTRLNANDAEQVCREFPDAEYDAASRTLIRGQTVVQPDAELTPDVAVVSAGSCDASVAREALVTLRWMQIPATLIEDVGVAGPQRLLSYLPVLKNVKAIVCVAGMEAALPSVVGGHVDCPVIGVPTSVGYGASFGGLTALLSMLTCCASNVVAVNIDAGFRGGYVAGMIAGKAT